MILKKCTQTLTKVALSRNIENKSVRKVYMKQMRYLIVQPYIKLKCTEKHTTTLKP